MPHYIPFPPLAIPHWTNYLAQDSSGGWFAYEYEPAITGGVWSATGGQVTYIATSAPPPDHTLELYTLT